MVTTNYNLSEIPNIVTDVKDNYLFALAEKATAEYLVTGDKLLLNIKEYQKAKVVTLPDFKIIVR